MNISDRRFATRFNVAIPLHFRSWNSVGSAETAKSINISMCGIYFGSDSLLHTGAALRLRLEMPKEITGVSTVQWICVAHVVRLQSLECNYNKQGVAVHIDCIESLRNQSTDTALSVIEPPFERDTSVTPAENRELARRISIIPSQGSNVHLQRRSLSYASI
jgi:hypothetical protein